MAARSSGSADRPRGHRSDSCVGWFGEMLPVPRRWIRKFPPSFSSPSTRRRHCLWMLLILLLVCVTIQTFLIRHARGVKLMGLLSLTSSLSEHKPTLPNSAAANEDPRWRTPTQRPANTEAACRPKSHIVFLKTHKTASSSILNVLYRYGESRNLSFALPLKQSSQLFYPFFFSSHFVEGAGSRRRFHILCNHMRFRKSEVAKVMPQDAFYFSVLRHPAAMMESIFIYYKSIPAFRKTPSLDRFLDSSWRNYNSSVSNNHYAHNVLAFDFGFDNNVADEDLDERASAAIATIERDFHLVLISDYFEESMVLLRHALCWSLEDVVSFRLNSRSQHTRHRLSADTAERVQRWNALDWRIYLHFNASFWRKVERLVGQEAMRREVSELRGLQAKLANTCLKEGGAVHPSRVRDAALKPFQYGAAVIQGYNLNPQLEGRTRTTCQRLITPELQYTKHLFTQQFPEVAAKLRQRSKGSV